MQYGKSQDEAKFIVAVTPLDTHGTVYGGLTPKDSWGTLTADETGALLSADWAQAVVPAVVSSSAAIR